MTATKENEGLIITPSELKFRFQLAKTIPTQIILYNPTNERYAFKVKTTSPKKYCVRPSSGFVDPQSNRHVEVIMQSQKEYPTDLGNCKDKFLLQSVVVKGDVSDIKPELFDKATNRDVKETKLNVFLEGPPAPPSPIEEEQTESEDMSTYKEKTDASKYSTATRLSPQLGDDDVEKLRRERDELRKQLDILRLQTGTSGSKVITSKDGKQQMIVRTGFTMFHLIMAAVIAFLIGHYTS